MLLAAKRYLVSAKRYKKKKKQNESETRVSLTKSAPFLSNSKSPSFSSQISLIYTIQEDSSSSPSFFFFQSRFSSLFHHVSKLFSSFFSFLLELPNLVMQIWGFFNFLALILKLEGWIMELIGES